MQVDAGGEVAITVTTKPNAFVGISAIDQSSLLLSKRNDINEVFILLFIKKWNIIYIIYLSILKFYLCKQII